MTKTALHDSVTQDRRAHDNAFDLVRLLAAIIAIYDHASLLGGPQNHALSDFGYANAGSFAVAVFFALSGYLVTQSWLADPNLPRFLAKRCLRIFPALITVVLLSVFVIGPLLSKLSVADYFSNSATWAYLQNISLFFQQKTLPGVFTTNPSTAIFNGPLWSLPYEFTCYLIVGFAGKLGLYRLPYGNLALALIFFASTVIYSLAIGIDTIDKTPIMSNARHIEAFIAGSLLATRDVRLMPKLVLLPCLLALAALTMLTTKMIYISPVLIAIGVIAIGRNFALSIGKDDTPMGFICGAM